MMYFFTITIKYFHNSLKSILIKTVVEKTDSFTLLFLLYK